MFDLVMNGFLNSILYGISRNIDISTIDSVMGLVHACNTAY